MFAAKRTFKKSTNYNTMKGILFLLLLVVLSQFSSCVIINPGSIANGNRAIDRGGATNNESLELALAKFPLNYNVSFFNNSLHMTVVNSKRKTIADIDLIGDTVSIYGEMQLLFNVDVRDFNKTRILSTVIYCPLRLFENLTVSKVENDYYKVAGKEGDSSGSCVIQSKIISSDREDVVYSYTGELINEYGTTIAYSGLGDPPPAKVVIGLIIIGSNITENMQYIIDICNMDRAIEYSRKNAKCPNPRFKIIYYPKPFAKLFYRDVFDKFYRDCKAEPVCP